MTAVEPTWWASLAGGDVVVTAAGLWVVRRRGGPRAAPWLTESGYRLTDAEVLAQGPLTLRPRDAEAAS